MKEQAQVLDFMKITEVGEDFWETVDVPVLMDVRGETNSFVVKVYGKFSPLKVKMCVQELILQLDKARGKREDAIDNISVPYMIFMIIKHFTTLKLPNSFAEQLVAIEHMTNTGTMLQIFAQMDVVEINKVQDEVQSVLEAFNSNVDKSEDFIKTIKDQLVDKSLLE